jgi:anti-sigma B factor antagonist
MPGNRSPLMVCGVPVVAAPAEIDIATAEQLRTALFRAIAARRHATVVLDMTRTRFCDSAGLAVLVQAHRRALAHDGELRLVLKPDGPVSRVFAIARLDLLIPLFHHLEEALPARPTAAIRTLRALPPR